MTNIRYELQNLKRMRKAYDPKLVGKAERSANVKTTRKGRTRVSKLVRSRYAVKADRLTKAVSLKTFDQGDLTQSVLKYVGNRIGLINFTTKARANPAANLTKRGKPKKLTVKVRKDGGRKTLKGFVAVGKNDNIHIFARTGAPRYPLQALKTISVPEMVGSNDVQTDIDEFVGEEYPQQFQNEMTFFLNKATGR